LKGFVLFWVILSIFSCTEPAKYVDGWYFSASDEFSPTSGWKDVIRFQIENDQFVFLEWNGVHIFGGPDRISLSKQGLYRMVEKGSAQAPWYIQSERVTQYVLDSQDPTAIQYSDSEGHSDVISGVSILVSDFYSLLQHALEQGPVEIGPYVDGDYMVQAPVFSDGWSNGWKDEVALTIYHGRIASVSWTAQSENPDADDKRTQSITGAYDMQNEGLSWHRQAQALSEAVIASQTPEIDVVSGVSIVSDGFFTLLKQALSQAQP
jgi:major membrane immunogen (membrane-anchored lipoprotein)